MKAKTATPLAGVGLDVPEFDPADIVHGDPVTFDAWAVTAAARVYLVRCGVEVADPVKAAHDLAEVWLGARW